MLQQLSDGVANYAALLSGKCGWIGPQLVGKELPHEQLASDV